MLTFNDALLVKEYAALGQPFVTATPATPLQEAAHLIHYNEQLSKQIGIDPSEATRVAGIQMLAGKQPIDGYDAISSVYCGHQFGVFVPQLGDGRALTIGEIRKGSQYIQLQLKGAGPTPYSRMGDGRAVLRSSIREYIASEALNALGVPTTRALSLVGTADPVFRETVETAAVVCRVSPSFLRFGHMEYFASTGQTTALLELIEWQIEHFHPHLQSENSLNADIILHWFAEVCERTADLVAKWQSVGFCHGVMNSDNMSLLGETIDYGPYAFMDDFQIDYICNHSDQNGRYSYRNQPRIAHWNCYALAQALTPIDGITPEKLQSVLDNFPAQFEKKHNQLFFNKLGLSHSPEAESLHQELVESTLTLLHEHQIDFTRFFRSLSAIEPSADTVKNWGTWQSSIFFPLSLGDEKQVNDFKSWLTQWINLVPQSVDAPAVWRKSLDKTNPAVVPRNHLLQSAIEMAQNGDFTEVKNLFEACLNPYDESKQQAKYLEKPPAWAKQIELSCSS